MLIYEVGTIAETCWEHHFFDIGPMSFCADIFVCQPTDIFICWADAVVNMGC